MPRLELTFVLALALPFGAVGCSSLTSTTSGGLTPAPTTIIVDPTAFLGDVPCGSAPGNLEKYVATLVDVTQNVDASTLGTIPSSPPSPCFKEVVFEKTTIKKSDTETFVTIQDGHEYEVQIDGYDMGAISPQSPGSRTMVTANEAGTTEVTSRWTATCGGRGTPLDAGGADATSVGVVDATTGSYGACRSTLLPDAAPYLGGPLCAYEGLVLTMRHCTPLRPR